MSTKTNRPTKPGKLQRFAAYYRPHKALFASDLVAASLIAGIDLLFPIVTRYSIQSLLPAGAYRSFFVLIAALVGIYFVRAGLMYFVTFQGHALGVHLENDMRRDLFCHLQKLSFGFYDKTRTGHLMSRTIGDLFEISELAHHGPEDLLISALTLTGALIVMFTLQWKLALAILIFVPLIVLFVMRTRHHMGAVSRDVKSKIAAVNADLESAISGVRVVQAFNNEDYEIEKFQKGSGFFKAAKLRYYKVMGVFFSGMELLQGLLYIVALAVGGYLILKGEMAAIELLTFTLYINAFLSPIRKLSNFMEQFTAGMAGFTRMQELMDVEPEIVDRPNAKPISSVRGAIRFDDVSFAYDEGDTVLSGIDLSVKAGEMLALVGPSGGGKTTLCQLIPRFYEQQSGRIAIDGTDIAELTLSSLREQIGIVQQDVFLFAGTIRENIRYGDTAASEEDVIAAAKAAEIHDFILTLPEGYDTNVGERGVMLSGGQKQRVAIARIFLKNPPILILDEATSALDSQTERRIQQSLEALAKGRTTIVIAHRLSTVKNADEIIYIDQNGIAERGDHETLMAKGGLYAELYETQFAARE